MSHPRACLTTPRHLAFLHTVRRPRVFVVAKWFESRAFNSPATPPEAVPLRKHLKDEAKRRKAGAKLSPGHATEEQDLRLKRWELTVGLEIHAELNTECKLFSSAPAASAADEAPPNTNVALFDAAFPGTQPQFQPAVLLPAIRAAIAFGCRIQRKSGWDRKHYFHWDQPNGYQITQYYEPFARDGSLSVGVGDGVPAADLNGEEHLNVGIKQIQMEQDTAKTIHRSLSSYHIDLNRAGHPLIEIITLPHIHSPQTAAAVARKIQAVLKAVNACVTGMELGGLRADVNVSVRERGTEGTSSYSGISGLGQRTEIKNLSSFAAIEHAIVAERDRQIDILASGGAIECETRGWTLGATETTRLRGKEGEVDYRYMPDPDLPSLLIGEDLVDHLRSTLPELPANTVTRTQQRYAISSTDAKTLAELDDGDRLEFMEQTVELMVRDLGRAEIDERILGKLVSNWVLHELGGLITTSGLVWTDLSITPRELADVLTNLERKQITARAAKQLLVMLRDVPIADNDDADAVLKSRVEALIDDKNLRLRPLSEDGYTALASQIVAENSDMVAAIKDKGQKGKVMWFVGQMIRRGNEGTVEPEKARQVIQRVLGL